MYMYVSQWVVEVKCVTRIKIRNQKKQQEFHSVFSSTNTKDTFIIKYKVSTGVKKLQLETQYFLC